MPTQRSGRRSARKARTSSRNAASDGSKSRSMSPSSAVGERQAGRRPPARHQPPRERAGQVCRSEIVTAEADVGDVVLLDLGGWYEELDGAVGGIDHGDTA